MRWQDLLSGAVTDTHRSVLSTELNSGKSGVQSNGTNGGQRSLAKQASHRDVDRALLLSFTAAARNQHNACNTPHSSQDVLAAGDLSAS
jgi:hypothetical protein